MVLTETAQAEIPRLCACGCGAAPKTSGCRFLRGHNNFARYGPQPRCRGCGRKASTQRRRLLSYDQGTNTYKCKWCKSQEVTCRRCGHVAVICPSRIKKLRSLRIERGKRTYLCVHCGGHDHARQRLLPSLLFKRYGISPRGDDPARVSAMQDHAARARKAGPGLWALAERHKNGLTAGGRRRLQIARLLGARRGGSFRLCPCGKLLYQPPFRKNRPGLHGTCYRSRLTDPAETRTRGRGRPRGSVDRQLLNIRYRWLLLRFLRHQGWGEIARAEQCERQTVKDGVKAFVALLPDSWGQVFGSGAKGGRQLDALLPIDRLRSTLRS